MTPDPAPASGPTPVSDRPSYLAGYNDGKAGRQYGEDRRFEPDPWLVPEEHRPSCAVSGQPCSSWTCLMDRCVEVQP